MATKKSKRSTSSKKSATTKSESAQTEKNVKAEAAKAEDQQQTTEPVEEVVEVIEVEEPTSSSTKEKASITDKLAALNPAALIAELLGTFVLTAAFIKLYNNTNYGLIGLALVLIANVVAFICISGAHFNPAITLAEWIGRKINGVKAVAYIVAQVLGAILAFFVLTGINNASYDYDAAIRKGVEKAGVTEETMESAGGYEKWLETYGGKEAVAGQLGITKTAPKLYQIGHLTSGKEWVAMLSEALGGLFVGVGAAFAYNKRKESKLAAGVAMGVALFTGLTVAGGSVILNPAVAITMGVWNWGNFANVVWPIVTYVLGPIIGATIGFIIYNQMAKNNIANEEAIES